MEKKPDEPDDVTNKPLPSMSEPTEVQDAVASTLATPFAQPIITASKSKAQKQREYRQRITASRTPAQAAAARKSKNERQRNNRLRRAANLAIASGSLETTTTSPSRSGEESNNVQTRTAAAAPKTRAQIQREYRQRIAASKTPAQAAAAREARNVRDRNNRLRQAANLVIASGSLEATTTSSSRSGQWLNTVHIDTQRQFTDQQRQTLATEPAETTVQPSTSSDQIQVQAQSTFLDNDFVRIREDLKEKWCREVKAEYFKVNTMFCCEDHLKPTEDLMNYYQCKLMKHEPKLKRTALLRNISHDDRTEGLSELKNILVQSPTSSKSLKKKYDDFDTSKASTRTLPGKSKYGTQYEDLAMPSTSTCSTLPIKVNSNEDSESGPSTSKRIRVQTPTEQNDNIVQHHILDIGNTTAQTNSPLSISTKDDESSITKIIIKTESSDTEIDIEETMLSETNTIADGESSDRNISIKMESRDTETGIEETGETTVFETNMTSIPMIHEDVVKAKKQDDMAFYKCNVCMRFVLGPRYTCVQCADYDICRSCETGGYHDQHYVLRIPPKQPESEIQERLDIIRRALDSISSTKPYKEFVKIEKVEDPLFAQDPLLEDTTCNLIPEQTDGDVPNEDDDDANDESYKPTESCDTAQDDVLDNSDSDSDYTPERSSWPIVKRTKLPVIMDKNLTPTNDDTSSLTCFEKNTVIKLYKHIESDADGIAECKIKEKVADIMQIPETTVNDIIKIYKDSGQMYPLNVKIYPGVKKAKFSSSTIKKGKGILFRNMTSNESFFAARIRDYIISTFPAAVPDMKNVYRTVSKITGWEAKCLDRLFKLEENRHYHRLLNSYYVTDTSLRRKCPIPTDLTVRNSPTITSETTACQNVPKY